METSAAVAQSRFENRPPKADRWAAFPACATLTIGLLIAVCCGLPGILSFVLIPFTALATPFVLAGLVVAAAVLALRRRPRLAISILVAALLPALLWRPITWTADVIHMGLTVWTGAGQQGRPSKPDGSPFAVYDWSVGLAGGPNTFLIRDVTDEIALPPEQHKQPLVSELGFDRDCAGKVTHLLGHYYVCTF